VEKTDKIELIPQGENSLWMEPWSGKLRIYFGKDWGYAGTKEATLTIPEARILAYRILIEAEKASAKAESKN
jgi:hypothetical protein